MGIIHLENIVILDISESTMFCKMGFEYFLKHCANKEIFLPNTKPSTIICPVIRIEKIGNLACRFIGDTFNRFCFPKSKRKCISFEGVSTCVIPNNRHNIGNSLKLGVLIFNDYRIIVYRFKPRVTICSPVIRHFYLVTIGIKSLSKQTILVV